MADEKIPSNRVRSFVRYTLQIAQNHSWDLAQEYLAIILAFTPILIPLLASFYAYVFTKKVRLNIHDIHVYSYHRCELLIN